MKKSVSSAMKIADFFIKKTKIYAMITSPICYMGFIAESPTACATACAKRKRRYAQIKKQRKVLSKKDFLIFAF